MPSRPPSGHGRSGREFRQRDPHASPARQSAELTDQRPLTADSPPLAVTVRSLGKRSSIFRKQVVDSDRNLAPGDLVEVRTEEGLSAGFGWWNPVSTIAVRLLSRSHEPPEAAWWDDLLTRAVELRTKWLRLGEVSDAWRVIHGEADALPGATIDRYGDVLAMEAYSLGAWQRGEAILRRLGELSGTPHWILRPGPRTLEQEGFEAAHRASPGCPREVVVREAETQFVVDLNAGHKTGFFCDQRENRLRLAHLAAGKSLLDLCCYTGGFSLQAKCRGGATDVIGVDLDESAIALARRNAGRNQARVRFVHADAFGYLRDLIRNGETFPVVVLDPPKLVLDRESHREGLRKYHDLNRLAAQVVADGGILLTCSCSGLVSLEEFRRVVFSSLPEESRAQLLMTSGAAVDHPVSRRDPETEYLKALWLRILK
jgi:23S rRNA (cytosine1962-C5)-methyltransferase